MKYKSTAMLAAATLTLGVSVYLFDYKRDEINEKVKEENSKLFTFNKDQVNYIEIQKKDERIVLQKSEDGWALLEPIQDQADNDHVESFIDTLLAEKSSAIAKETKDETSLQLPEFGLDQPYASFNLKNNLGQSRKIIIGSQRNFEGNPFLRIDTENRVHVGSPVWVSKADQNLMSYREKRLYRSPQGPIELVRVKSLQDEFELKRVNNKWVNSKVPEIELDQNKVREMIRQIAEATIQDYIVDGEPSKTMITDKKLINAPVKIQFETAKSNWAVVINQNEKDNAVYAMTDRPTSLVRIDPAKWEFFGNLTFDSLRDRAKLLRFNLSEARKVFFKDETGEYTFVKENEQWKPAQALPEGVEYSSVDLVKMLNRVHDLEVSEFFDKNESTAPFTGKNMIIISSNTDNLIFQLNWGPEVKLKRRGVEQDYYFSRTNLGSLIFALEKAKVLSLGFDQVIKKKEQKSE